MAKAYKRFGIIKNDKISCSKYFPVHFSTKSDDFLKLTKYTSISEEQNIIISNEPDTPPGSIMEINQKNVGLGFTEAADLDFEFVGEENLGTDDTDLEKVINVDSYHSQPTAFSLIS